MAQPDLPPVDGVDSVQALRVDDGVVTAWVWRGGRLVERRAQRTAWRDRDRTGAQAWDDEGAVFVQDAATVHGRRTHRAPRVAQDAGLVFDEDDAGQPLFAAADEGRLRVWSAGHAHEEAVARSQRIDRTVCPAEPRTEVVVQLQLPASGRLAFGPQGAVVPWVETVHTMALRCVERPPHPCDPAGG